MKNDMRDLTERLIQVLGDKGKKISVAESCTGGLIAAQITSVAGSSRIFDYGFVTYSNAAKQALIGVSPASLRSHGAVSGEVACEMATGALTRANADLSVAVTGVAGPGGGTQKKPIGLVFIAVAAKGAGVYVEEFRFGDIGRDEVRSRSVKNALEMLATYGLDDDFH